MAQYLNLIGISFIFLCILCIHFLRKKIHFLRIEKQFFKKKTNIIDFYLANEPHSYCTGLKHWKCVKPGYRSQMTAPIFQFCEHYNSIRIREREKNDKIVVKNMLAEARSVSLLSCEESTYMAVEVGRTKKTILTLKGSPVTLKKLSIK